MERLITTFKKYSEEQFSNYKGYMKTKCFLFVNLLLASALFSCNQWEEVLPVDDFSSKIQHKIVYSIAKAKDYSEPIYEGARAELTLTISSEDVRNGSNVILWDTVFALRYIREFPAPDMPLSLTKDITRITNGHEILRLSRSIRYFDEKNSTWINLKGETVPRNRDNVTVVINL